VKMFDTGKPRMIGLLYGEKNIAEKFNRLSRVQTKHTHNIKHIKRDMLNTQETV